jgi:hypothetical protein
MGVEGTFPRATLFVTTSRAALDDFGSCIAICSSVRTVSGNCILERGREVSPYRSLNSLGSKINVVSTAGALVPLLETLHYGIVVELMGVAA